MTNNTDSMTATMRPTGELHWSGLSLQQAWERTTYKSPDNSVKVEVIWENVPDGGSEQEHIIPEEKGDSVLPDYFELPEARKARARAALSRCISLPIEPVSADAVIENIWNALVGHDRC